MVREQCYEVTKNMELTETQGKESYKNLEKDARERVLVKRIQRLETFVKETYPQFMGLVEWCLWYVSENAEVISTCPQHFLNKKPRGNLLKLMKGCSVCRQMIKQLILYLKTSQQTRQRQKKSFSVMSPGTFQFGPGRGAGSGVVPAITESKYGGNRLIDEKVITIIQDFEKIIRFCETL